MIKRTPTASTVPTKKVGTSNNPIQTFKKDDYKTKRFLAAQFKVSQEIVEKTLKTMQIKRVSFVINGHKSPVVLSEGHKEPRVHPLALDIFEEYLEKQKAK